MYSRKCLSAPFTLVLITSQIETHPNSRLHFQIGCHLNQISMWSVACSLSSIRKLIASADVGVENWGFV